ncbi:MAG TPA: triose-phosphate isomerase [Pseudogracilibacillus sp.]|nr:triose-phosphate isomerase [Pseudogracilibacillus sp.]
MRKKIIAGNWKMNKTLPEIKTFMEELIQNYPEKSQIEAIVCAPFVYLAELVKLAEGTPIKIAAQTMNDQNSGAFTGEISPVMLNDIGVTHVIIGHSERREYYNETDETVNKKVQAAFVHNLTPIVCVGESLEQREANETLTHIESQIKLGLAHLTEEQIKETIIAYEPIWAIGTGKTATHEQANEVCGHIRSVVGELTNDSVKESITIQYGGSVNPSNIDELLQTEHIDGALVGGASLEADSFNQLIKAGVKI